MTGLIGNQTLVHFVSENWKVFHILHHSAYVLTRAFNVLEQHYFPWYHKVQIWSHENPRENPTACLCDEKTTFENVKSAGRQ